MTGEELFGVVVLMSIAFIVGYYVNIRTTMHTVRILKQEHESEKKIMNETHKLDMQNLPKENTILKIEKNRTEITELEKYQNLNKLKVDILTYVSEKLDKVGKTDVTLNDILEIILRNKNDS